jgi:hypothetical protein
MRQEFIRCEDAATEDDALKLALWAVIAIECEGGWQCFESWNDAERWEAQHDP